MSASVHCHEPRNGLDRRRADHRECRQRLEHAIGRSCPRHDQVQHRFFPVAAQLEEAKPQIAMAGAFDPLQASTKDHLHAILGHFQAPCFGAGHDLRRERHRLHGRYCVGRVTLAQDVTFLLLVNAAAGLRCGPAGYARPDAAGPHAAAISCAGVERKGVATCRANQSGRDCGRQIGPLRNFGAKKDRGKIFSASSPSIGSRARPQEKSRRLPATRPARCTIGWPTSRRRLSRSISRCSIDFLPSDRPREFLVGAGRPSAFRKVTSLSAVGGCKAGVHCASRSLWRPFNSGLWASFQASAREGAVRSPERTRVS